MSNLYVIIGEQNKRKSSTVRALSGYYHRKENDGKTHHITFTNGNVEGFFIDLLLCKKKI